MNKNNLRLPWTYISREEVIKGSGLQYGTEDWGIRDRNECFIAKFVAKEDAEVIIAAVNEFIKDK